MQCTEGQAWQISRKSSHTSITLRSWSPEQITTLDNGEKFLLFDSGNNMQRILMFGTQQNLDILKRSENWFCDGTFKASPLLFDQLFIIHSQFRDLILSLVYILMPNHTQATYSRVLWRMWNGIWHPTPFCATSNKPLSTPFIWSSQRSTSEGAFFISPKACGSTFSKFQA